MTFPHSHKNINAICKSQKHRVSETASYSSGNAQNVTRDKWPYVHTTLAPTLPSGRLYVEQVAAETLPAQPARITLNFRMSSCR